MPSPSTAALEGFDAGRQKQRANGNACADAENASRVPAMHLLLHIVKAGTDALGVFEQARAGLGQLQTAAYAVKKYGSIVLFQLLDGRADGGLGHVLRFRGLGRVTAVVAHFQKNAHVSQGHGCLLGIQEFLWMRLHYIIFLSNSLCYNQGIAASAFAARLAMFLRKGFL